MLALPLLFTFAGRLMEIKAQPSCLENVYGGTNTYVHSLYSKRKGLQNRMEKRLKFINSAKNMSCFVFLVEEIIKGKKDTKIHWLVSQS